MFSEVGGGKVKWIMQERGNMQRETHSRRRVSGVEDGKCGHEIFVWNERFVCGGALQRGVRV